MVSQLKQHILSVGDKMFGKKGHFLLNEIFSRTQIRPSIRHLPTHGPSYFICICHLKNSMNRIRTNCLLKNVILKERHYKNCMVINYKLAEVNQFSNGCQRLFSTSGCIAQKKVENQDEPGNSISSSDTEDVAIKPVLETFTSSHRNNTFVNIVPGKGCPPEPPLDCCMSGCANCVWIRFAEDLKKYYSAEDARDKMLEEIESLENTSLKMFLKMELGLT
ncbi:hypothetical protein CHS0354_025536 [Potamilus streckersoni]|uniref:Oxidoreductase-like domain-containing protein n=1 Tax=Potamilus streckersoni TaxID=2493646 RepID=A0AAE0SKI9_9BIVA|nr:hypothetical protein CHS0354_025536 [Potamilus streckersoni]